MRFSRYAIVIVILLLTSVCPGCADFVQSILYGIFPVGSSQERGISDRTRAARAALGAERGEYDASRLRQLIAAIALKPGSGVFRQAPKQAGHRAGQAGAGPRTATFVGSKTAAARRALVRSTFAMIDQLLQPGGQLRRKR